MAVNCQWVEDHTVDAVDRRLAIADEVRLLDHLDGCPRCAARAALWGDLIASLRAAEPPAPSASRTRRMEAAIERALDAPAASRPTAGRRFLAATAVAAALLVVAGGVAWRFLPRRASAGAAPIAVAPAHDPAPVIAQVADGAHADLTVGPATLRVVGRATLTRSGDGSHLVLRLDGGALSASVRHLAADETFAVATRDGTIFVRGTRFAVAHRSDGGSYVRVFEGRVTIERADRSRSDVAAGESSAIDRQGGAVGDFADDPFAPAATGAEQNRIAAPATPVRKRAVSSSEVAAVRAELERHEDAQAIARLDELVLRQPARDDLHYLRAEALRRSGRGDDAVREYEQLAQRARGSATRENALHAAAAIERRAGRPAVACRLYRRALSAAPHGALVEEAMAGIFETAHEAGDRVAERAAIDAYLARFPSGRFRGEALGDRAHLPPP